MGPSRKEKNKDYYAVVKGRLDEPTIFSSWGDAHPRVTGCDAEYKAFSTIEEARGYMKKQGVSTPQVVIKNSARDTTPEWNSMSYYAVAHGAKPGIYPTWYGDTGALKKTNEISGACYKWFRTKAQAEAFIEDWKESFADVWRREVKMALDRGCRPQDMKLSIGGILQQRDEDNVAEITRQLDTNLRLDEP